MRCLPITCAYVRAQLPGRGPHPDALLHPHPAPTHSLLPCPQALAGGSRLTSLNLSGNNIGDAGAKALAEMLKVCGEGLVLISLPWHAPTHHSHSHSTHAPSPRTPSPTYLLPHAHTRRPTPRWRCWS